jgi:pyrroline-5-carboxylate reductase
MGMKIAFIGGGNMGEAMLSAVLDKKLSTPSSVSVSDVSEARRQHLGPKYGVAVTADNLQAVNRGDIVVLAIKPQNLAGVMAELKGRLRPAQLVLSIIAGARLDTLRQGLGHDVMVRAMPNTPAQIGEGITVWTAAPAVSGAQRGQAAAILGAMGGEIYVADEQYLDMATAVSGSGPAYFFYMVESLVQAALDIGLPPPVAEELVLQTLLGSGHLIQKSVRTPAELRRMVTSPGGTTAAAMLRLEEGGFADLIRRAVRAAYERAKQLGGQAK